MPWGGLGDDILTLEGLEGLGDIQPLVATIEKTTTAPTSTSTPTTGAFNPSGSTSVSGLPPGTLSSGPFVKVGPILMPPKGTPSPLRFTCGALSGASSCSKLPDDFVRFVLDQYLALSERRRRICAVSGAATLACSVDFARSHRGLNAPADGGSNFIRTANGALFKPLIEGRVPIAKVENPIEGGDWGLYVEWTGGVDGKPPAFLVSFRRVDKGFLGALWDWLVKIVGVVIETLGNLLDAVRKIACAAARTKIDALARFANFGTPLPDDVISFMKAKGYSDAQINSLKAGHDFVDKTLATAMVNATITELCPSPKPNTDGNKKPFRPLVTIGIGAGAAAILYAVLS